MHHPNGLLINRFYAIELILQRKFLENGPHQQKLSCQRNGIGVQKSCCFYSSIIDLKVVSNDLRLLLSFSIDALRRFDVLELVGSQSQLISFQ